MKDNDELIEMPLMVDPQEIVEDINIEEIEEAAVQASLDMCKNLREVYFDEKFMSENPLFKKRLDVELESLRVLIKMRRSDEIAHDLCLRSIGANSNNASLYAALARIQTSMLNIQKQMDETVKNINSLLKNVQLEFNFDKSDTTGIKETVDGKTTGTTRGSKSFIEQMNAEMKSENKTDKTPDDENELFED